MTQKFGRNYRLTISTGDGLPPILITMPFTIQFWMTRDNAASMNQLSIDVYNLSEENRSRIFQDRNAAGGTIDASGNIVLDKYGFPAGVLTVILEAGYSTLYRVFQGHIYEANSSREGTEMVTRIEALEGDYDVSTTMVFQTLQSGQTLGDVLKFLMGQFRALAPGAVGDYSQVMTRPVVLNGNAWALIKQYSAGNVYIDGGKIYALQPNEVLSGQIPVINDATGLLETPRRENGLLIVTTLLETGINVNQEINLESTTQPVYNGQYVVIGVQHQGTISGAVGGDARTILKLRAPNAFTKKVAPL